MKHTACYHLPGLFEFYELYRLFLPLFREHREYFYDWCEIGSIYGAPPDCIWGGGRVEAGEPSPAEVLALTHTASLPGSHSAIPCSARSTSQTGNATQCVSSLPSGALCRMGSSSTPSCF